MRLRLPLALCLVCATFAPAQNPQKVHLRFFNDSAKFVSFMSMANLAAP